MKTGSATGAIQAWVAAKFPVEKIVLGVPGYGHTFTVSPSSAVDSSGTLVSHPPFTKNGVSDVVDQCGNKEPVSDIKNFAALIAEGFLNDDGTPTCEMKYQFDNCSQTVSPGPFCKTHSASHGSFTPLALPLRRGQAADGILR